MGPGPGNLIRAPESPLPSPLKKSRVPLASKVKRNKILSMLCRELIKHHLLYNCGNIDNREEGLETVL